jgi:hypothetical protein
VGFQDRHGPDGLQLGSIEVFLHAHTKIILATDSDPKHAANYTKLTQHQCVGRLKCDDVEFTDDQPSAVPRRISSITEKIQRNTTCNEKEAAG